MDFGSSKCFVLISDRTLVRVLPFEAGSAPKSASLWLCQQQFGSQLLGESVDATSTELLDEVIDHFDPEIVQALKLRMSRLLAQTVRIGTSVDAIPNLQKQTQRRANMMRGLLSYTTKPPTLKNDKDDTTPADSPKNPIVGSSDSVVLTVHSPEEAAGKTLLAKAIAHRLLRCPTVHVLQPAALMAKHGVHADAALESLLHDIVISAAVRGSVCIILDHLDCLLPSNQSGGAEDPVINGMGKDVLVLLSSRKITSMLLTNVLFSFSSQTFRQEYCQRKRSVSNEKPGLQSWWGTRYCSQCRIVPGRYHDFCRTPSWGRMAPEREEPFGCFARGEIPVARHDNQTKSGVDYSATSQRWN